LCFSLVLVVVWGAPRFCAVLCENRHAQVRQYVTNRLS
jgi:hypothetical protein